MFVIILLCFHNVFGASSVLYDQQYCCLIHTKTNNIVDKRQCLPAACGQWCYDRYKCFVKKWHELGSCTFWLRYREYVDTYIACRSSSRTWYHSQEQSHVCEADPLKLSCMRLITVYNHQHLPLLQGIYSISPLSSHSNPMHACGSVSPCSDDQFGKEGGEGGVYPQYVEWVKIPSYKLESGRWYSK